VNTVSLLLQLVGIVGIVIAIGQLWEVRKKRQVDMYWQVLDRYLAKEAQESRAVLTRIENVLEFDSKHPPEDISRFIAAYIAEFKAYESEALIEKLGERLAQERQEQDQKARFRIRFVNQAGVLLEKRLIDKDLLFELLGPGVEIDYPIMQVVVDAYRKDHRIHVYRQFEPLVARYERWAGKGLPRLGSRAHGSRVGQHFLSQVGLSACSINRNTRRNLRGR
jgi:hypothetical protein